METQILLDQLDSKIKKALSLIIYLYSKLKNEELEKEEVKGLMDITEALKCFLNVVYEVKYNGNIDKFKDNIYGIARGLENDE